jgi:hypothetical protein
MANTKTQNATANTKAASAPAKALSAKAIKAQEAKSAKFFAEQEAATKAAMTTPAPTDLVHPVVTAPNPFGALFGAPTAPATPAPVAAPKAVQMVQNGATAYRAGTLGDKTWELIAKASKAAGRFITIAELRAHPECVGDIAKNCANPYARYRKFHAVHGRVIVRTAKQVEGQDAGLVPLQK